MASYRNCLLAMAMAMVLSVSARCGETPVNSWMDMLTKCTVAIVVEYGDAKENRSAYGSGFLIGDGYVVTNAHVVDKKAVSNIYVMNEALPDNTKAEVVGIEHDQSLDYSLDLIRYVVNSILANSNLHQIEVKLGDIMRRKDFALLRLDEPESAELPIPVINPAYRVLEDVTALGYPHQVNKLTSRLVTEEFFWKKPGKTTPLVFAPGKINAIVEGDPVRFVYDAHISGGNSGGPIVNERGEIIGMETWSTWAEDDSENSLSVAIAAEEIVDFLRRNGISPKVVAMPAERPGPGREDDWKMSEAKMKKSAGKLLALAEGGDNNCQAIVGFLYYLGECGFERDVGKALAWLEQSLVDLSDGQFGTQNIYLIRGGLAAIYLIEPDYRNPSRGKELLKLANFSDVLDPGDLAHADRRLLAFEAEMYSQGEKYGVEFNPERSLILIQERGRDGDPQAQAIAGYHYYFGDSINYRDRNESLALDYAFSAANEGITTGISLLAHLYHNSDVVDDIIENAQIAFDLATEADRLDDAWAAGLLAEMYFEGTPIVDRDYGLAEHYAVKALRSGNRYGMYCYGKMLWDRAVNEDSFDDAIRAWAFLDLAESRGVNTTGERSPDRNLGLEILRNFESGDLGAESRQTVIMEGRKVQREYLARVMNNVPVVVDGAAAKVAGAKSFALP